MHLLFDWLGFRYFAPFGVYMRDNLPSHPYENECGIVNFNTSNQSGSHWVAYYKKNNRRIYFERIIIEYILILMDKLFLMKLKIDPV